jgi:nucleoside-diphosphate-sugar epimerase
MTEDLPLAATTLKRRTRAALTQQLVSAAEAGRVRIAVGRASDFFGAGVTESTLGERVFANALAGKRADFLGNPDLPHGCSYVPDIAAGLATLGTDDRAAGGVWHLRGPETVTTRQILALIAEEVGHPVAVRSVPKLLLRTLGLVNPMMRGLAEMAYEFEEPFVLDTSKYESTFGAAGAPLAAAITITTTIAWYRSAAVTPLREGPTSSPGIGNHPAASQDALDSFHRANWAGAAFRALPNPATSKWIRRAADSQDDAAGSQPLTTDAAHAIY